MKRNNRRGHSVIELLLVMTALALIFGICTALIQSLFRLDRIGRAHMAEIASRDRLARQFRTDVHAAQRDAELGNREGENDELTLNLPDGRVVEYRTSAGRLSRIERRGENVLRRESYAFPARGSARFGRRADEGAAFVTLVLARKPDAKGLGSASEIRIEAQLGKDRHVAMIEETKE